MHIPPDVSQGSGGFFCARVFARHAPLAPGIPADACSQKPPASSPCAQALCPPPRTGPMLPRPYILMIRRPGIPESRVTLPDCQKVTGPALLSRRLLSCRKWGILHDLSGEFLLSHTSRTRLASRLLHRAKVSVPAPSGAGAGTFEDSRDSASTFP